MSQVQGGGNRVMSFGRSKAKLVNKDTPKTTFADVAGADEAIEELEEIKEFLANPAKFQAIGAKIPKGVLLYGPPGTGKTLLARAVAGEAGVPFYSISGSDFVEMFVGVGASRVRDLFEQAKANAPSIIFVDEIDAVGRHRGAGMGGGHDEREQTLNQLLVEMDGFDVKGGVILIAATNRPDILDPALLRPGRFDRQIAVGPPDVIGREAVLKVHAKGKPFAADVDLSVIARRTPGFTGADLANVINEAALLTARNNGRLITTHALEESIDRVIAGPERKTRAMSDKEKRVTAYHEAGHALTAWAMPNLDPVHKVTILPRGRSLGHTLVLPLEDRYTQTRAEILDQLVYALGGRAAEELVFHEPTTGASNDIEKATKLARAMVTEYGMSTKLGAVKYGTGDAEPFMGRDYGHQRDYSEDIAADIDGEVRDLIEGAHDEAWEILVSSTATCSTRWCSSSSRRRRSRKDDLERILGAGAQAARRTTRSPRSASAPRATGRRSRSRRHCASRRRTARPTGAHANGGHRRTATRPERAAGCRCPSRTIAAAARDAVPGARPSTVAQHGSTRRRGGTASTWPARRGRGARTAASRSARIPTATGCKATPARVARAYAEIFAGLHVDPDDVLQTTFDENHDELVLVKDIPLYSTCEHHLVPWHGTAAVGYIPGEDGRITGLSKLARVVDLYARRPQVQERLTSQVADAVMRRLKPHGVIVVIAGRAPVHGDARRAQAGRADRSPPRCAASSRTIRAPAPRR